MAWLGAVVVVSLAHPWVPAPRWLMIHLLLLGAVSHAILVWSRHFTDALLHTPSSERDRRLEALRLALLNGGTLVVVTGVVTSAWWVTSLGAVAVVGAVVQHGWTLLTRLRQALPARFAVTVRYYVAAAALLPVGATLGVVLARGLDEPLHARVTLAHAAVNLLGWMGLTVVGTLVTLWPTMLRTRLAEGTEAAARRALPALTGAVLASVTGALAGQRLMVAAALAAYLAALGLVVHPLADAARRKPPATFATWSVLAGVAWLTGVLAAVAVGLAAAESWPQADRVVGWFTPFLAAGFAAQVLLGALSYLVPVALGGGPAAVRAADATLDRGWPARLVLANGGLLVAVLPVPSLVRVVATVLVLAAFTSFLPLLALGIRASRRARAAASPRLSPSPRPAGQLTGLASAGLAVVVLAVAVGVALDPSALAGARDTTSASAGVASNGRTRTVEVTAADMRFTPSRISVQAGTRLVLRLTNADTEDVHDLVLDSGTASDRLSPGESATLHLGVVGRAVEGWCSIVGHREMGMTLSIAVGDGDRPAKTRPSTEKVPPHDASLPPLPEGRVHRRTLTVREVERPVAAGRTQRLWTFDGNAPGPVLHGRVGDVFEITLVNDGTIGHSIDFHAGALAPDRPMRTIAPGQSLTYRFRATRAGIWMYHCSSMPMSAHIANGMFGAVVIEPDDLPPVDRSYVLVQSELYLGPDGQEVDVAKLRAERPDLVVFNGHADRYDARPLTALTGERVRLWLLDAGPNRATSFHVVGGQFDTVWTEGRYLLDRAKGTGAQVLPLQPAQGGFVELTFPEPGHYPFVSHVMVDAERGAHGVFAVDDPAAS